MGTSLLKNYTVDKDPYMSGGFKNMWKIYKGTPKTRPGSASVFVFEKKALDKFSKEEREEVLNILRREVTSLAKYKHPNVLGIYELLLEDKSTLVFVTEYINFSLSSWIETGNISKLEVKLMISQLCQVISFFHENAKIIHSNLTPNNIFIDEKGQIKVSGLCFLLNDPPITGVETKYNTYMHNALPNLKFTAPEIVFDATTYYQSDLFSLGAIIYFLVSKTAKDKSINTDDLIALNSNSYEAYKKFFESGFDKKLSNLEGLETEDVDIVIQLLNRTYSRRPTILEFSEDSWFNDPKLKALKFVESLESNDMSKNTEFLGKFPSIITFFDNKIIEKRFLPVFMNALKIEGLIVSTLPCVFAISEKAEISFEKVIWPSLKTLFQHKHIPAAALFYILSRLNYIAENISNTEFSSNMFSIVCKALDCGVPKIQSVVLDNLNFIIKKVDSMNFKNQLFPRLVNIVTTTTSNSLKIQILKAFKSAYSLLDQNIINESLLNTLEKIRKGDNNELTCISLVDIYEEIAKVVSVEVLLYLHSQLQIKFCRI